VSTTDDHLGIVELGAICADLRARNIDLFEQLGGWVVDTPEPALQRLFAEASHLHAWHAELWAQRAPVIPPVELDTSVAAAPTADVAASERAATYHRALARLLDDLRALRGRVDDLLDPSTVRTASLATADLTELEHRLTAAMSHS
jgi:hypothetical protein